MKEGELRMLPAEELRYLILAVQREGSRQFAQMFKHLDITSSQSEVLRVLYDFGPLSLAEVGALLVCETGSPSRLIKRMIDTGWVDQRQSSADLRKVELSLTAAGAALAEEVRRIEERAYAVLTQLMAEMPIEPFTTILWRFLEGKPAGKALATRKSKQKTRELTASTTPEEQGETS
jgi:DNA-binding MarR family transcriptional regulator